ncbi:MAG TPA: carboxypeptidase-like regulatory domain-containing protein, partial [Bryobacteraceae bacterium]|nr:carboxypeptidase-like regulatory domain-containing protein [Bryobacteraceae bacterium]
MKPSVPMYLCLLLTAAPVFATVFGTVRGVVHDPSHRPIAGAEIALSATASSYTASTRSNDAGQFEFPAVPIGEYKLVVRHTGFADSEQRLVVVSGTAPVLHFQLGLAEQRQSVEVSESPEAVNPSSSTPDTLVTRRQIEKTPGAALSNSLA